MKPDKRADTSAREEAIAIEKSGVLLKRLTNRIITRLAPLLKKSAPQGGGGVASTRSGETVAID
jgi:hypothetical protein